MKRLFLSLVLTVSLAQTSYATESQLPYTPSRYCYLLSEVTHSVALARDEGLTGNEAEQLLIKEGLREDVIGEVINAVYLYKDTSYKRGPQKKLRILENGDLIIHPPNRLRIKVKESCLSLMKEKRHEKRALVPMV